MVKNNNVHFMSLRSDWKTPIKLYEELDKEFHFNLDPCATHETALCLRHFTKENNGLEQFWGKHRVKVRVFMNPPYGREIGKWMKKAYQEYLDPFGPKVIVCLIPSRTDTLWWHNYVMKANEIRFIKGRLKFDKAKNCAPFPSCIVVFRGKQNIVKRPRLPRN